MRRISILGATGSIGQQTIDLVSRDEAGLEVVALTGGRNLDQLVEDALRLRPSFVATGFEDLKDPLRERLAGHGIEVGAGPSAVLEAAARPADWIMSAIVGAAGLPPTLTALAQGTSVALANKESLVCAGPLVLAAAQEHGATLLPVDSEHSAIFQALRGERIEEVERVIITASGGAFRDRPLEELPFVTVAEASTHPNWDMGQRITIDSASMFNKSMELIEAKELFGLSREQIEVVIHPESLIHALVGFRDGALMAHVGPHDMRHAIGHALNWPDRGTLPVERLDLTSIGTFSFAAPDPARYPALELAWSVMEAGGLAGAAFTAAKEAALDAFIAGQIGFTDMAPLVATTMDQMSSPEGLGNAELTLDNVLQTDIRARAAAQAAIKQ